MATEPEVPVNADFLALDKERVEAGGVIKAPIQPRPAVADSSQQDGLKAEARFQEWARKTWPTATVRPSCSADNKEQHWDVLLQSPEAVSSAKAEGVRIDVKAARKQARHDHEVATTHTWIELQSANAAFCGSLFGDAEMFAFERADGTWLLAARHQLAQLIMNMLTRCGMKLTQDKEEAVAKRPRPDAPFVLYNRRGCERLLWFPMCLLEKYAWSPEAYGNLRDMELAFMKVEARQRGLAKLQEAAKLGDGDAAVVEM